MSNTAPASPLLKDLSHLRDTELVSRLDEALGKERVLAAEIITYLAEIERRELHLAWAYSSMHDYCVRDLHMSDARAYRRISVARRAQRFPMLLGMLKTGELHLTAAAIVAPHLTRENCSQVLARARFGSKRQVEEIVAALNPRPDAKPVLRRLVEPASAVEKVAPVETGAAQAPQSTQPMTVAPLEAQRPGLHKQEPVSEDASEGRGKQLAQQPEQAPEAQKASVDTTATTTAQQGQADKQTSPAALASTQPLGNARYRLHFMDPYAKGGVHAVGNVTLRCKSHNQFHARRDFGKQFIATRIERARTKQESRGALVQPSCSHTDTDEPSPHQVNQTTGGQPTLPGESSQARLTRM